MAAVLVFHFFPALLPFGYLGVDLFFVISGFLISLYIVEETKANSFSFATFYVRRIKRILPVTLTMLTLTLVAATFILIGTDYDKFIRSVIATLTFTSNIFFWRDGGYFGSSDALKPLLHTWSLAVEEQFYLFFPVLLFALSRLVAHPLKRMAAVAAVAGLSFIGNLLLIKHDGATPAFFLTPFRVWQFGMGTLAALSYHHYYKQHDKKTFPICIMALLAGLFFFPNVLAPGFIVTIAAAWFLARRYVKVPIADAYFANPVIRKIGLISFSLYLWHWPVLAFLRYVTIDSPPRSYLVMGLILTSVLSLASYRYVEEPFRRTVRQRTTVSMVFGGVVVLILGSLAVLHFGFADKQGDASQRIASAIQTNFRCEVSDYIRYGAGRACLMNKDLHAPYHLALIGNSHAQMYVPAVERVLRARGESGLLIPLNGCLPTIDINISPECLRLAKLNYQAFMADKSIKTVVFSLTWYSDEWINESGRIVRDPDKTALSKSLLHLISLVKASGRDVFLVGPIQVPGYNLPSILSRKVKFEGYSGQALENSLRVPRTTFDSEFKDSVGLLSNELGDNFIRPSDELCDSRYCYLGDPRGVFFSDNSHLSSYGVSKVENLFNALETH